MTGRRSHGRLSALNGVVHQGTIESVEETSRLFLYVIYAATVLFLLKGIYYAINILSITKQFRLTPYSVYDFQSTNLADVLRDDVAATIWSYEQAKRGGPHRLDS